MLPPPRAMAAPMATAMAMMAHTEDSRPERDARRARWWPGRCGPPRRCRAPGVVSVDVKYSVIRLATWAEHEADDDGAEHAPAGVARSCPRRCRRRRRRRRAVPMTVRMPAVRKPRLIGAMRRLVLLGRPAPRRRRRSRRARRWPRRPSGKMSPIAHFARVVGIDRLEGGDAEDDRGDQRDLVALEQVGGHAGAVADVVAHVVGDGGRVAGVVLGDARLDLADEVGADVGRLGEDAAADPQEQGEQRAAEAEADEDRRRRVLEDHDDDRRAEQAEADGEHAGDATGAERHLQGRRASSPSWPRPRCARCRAPRGSCR